MNRTILIPAILYVIFGIVSCVNNKKTSVEDQTQDSPLAEILYASGDTIMLSAQALTSYDKMMAAFDNGYEPEEDSGDIGDYLHEATPDTESFFFREPDINDTELARHVQLRYNYFAIINKINHGLEWVERVASGVVGDEENLITTRDTLRWIKESQPDLPDKFINSCLPSPKAQRVAKNMLKAYRNFDGNMDENSCVYKAFDEFHKTFMELPEIVSEETLSNFKEEFWGWYDKRRHIHSIDILIRMNMKEYQGEKLTEEQITQLERAVKCEKNIDRRTILALELAKFDSIKGAVLLGDILKSGIYTPYLLEAWISWRANAQMCHGTSSYSVIADNYFDRLRVKCLNTFLRHCQEEDDDYAKCMMENMIQCENLHRMSSLVGNEGFMISMQLAYYEFIDPRLLNDEEEKDGNTTGLPMEMTLQ